MAEKHKDPSPDAAEKDAKARAVEAERAAGPERRPHDIAKLRDLKAEYDQQLELTGKLVPGSEKLKAALDRKRELTVAMDKIKRRYDLPNDFDPNAEAESAAPADDTRVLHGHKLSVYRHKVGGKTGDERLAALQTYEGVGPAKAQEIADALDGK